MKTFREFIEGELFGWLSPRGRFHRCDRWGHLDLILKTPELRSMISDTSLERAADLERETDEANARVRDGRHPEWHSIEAMKDGVQGAMTDELYEKGFLRVASRKEDLHFEGTPNAIKNLYQKARDMAEERGGKAHFQPVNYLR